MNSTAHGARLTGQVALITGGAARIGAAIARALHGQGCDLILHYRQSATKAAELKTELEAERADSVQLAQADLTATEAIDQLARSVGQWRGRLDILVNNASSFYPTALPDVQSSAWNDLIGTNLRAPFFLTQQLIPWLTTSCGCVINLVDIHAERPMAGYPVYSIAKAGNAMMVKALARELAPAIRVNGIAPGAILWPGQEPSPKPDQLPDQEPAPGMDGLTQAEILARTPLQRTGSPDDIAKTLLFLVLDAPYITGQIIAVDGGRTLQQ